MSQSLKSRGRFSFAVLSVALGVITFVGYAISKFVPSRMIIPVVGAAFLGFIIVLVSLARRWHSPGEVVRTVALVLLAVVLASYAVLFPLIYFLQDTLADRTSVLFRPYPMTEEAAQALVAPGIEALEIITPDQVMLRGWLVKNSPQARAPLVIFFDGSGSDISAAIPYAQRLEGWSVALVSYRGFGRSEGTPTHANVLADATTIYDVLSERADIDADRIVAMGYSLGTGVAVHLATQRPVAATILASPYDFWRLTGASQSGVYVPLGPIMKRYFDSLSRAPAIKSPLLCLIGAADPVISPQRSLRLAEQWGGPKTVKIYEGEKHDLLWHDQDVWLDIAAFLRTEANAAGTQP